jgi:hypothetical protein
VTFLAAEAGTYGVTVGKAGHEQATRAVRLEVGSAVVAAFELARSATGSLVIAADEALRRELPSVKVVLEHVGSDDEPLDVVLDLAGGTGRVDGLTAGRWIVEVEPEEGSFGPYYESYRRLERFEIDVEPGATVRRRLASELGGRARIALEGFDDEVEDLSTRLLGPDGSAIRGRFVTRRYEANVISVSVDVGAIRAHGTSTLYPNLEPGTYQLVLEREGWSIEPVAFTIVTGETVDVRVRGQRR